MKTFIMKRRWVDCVWKRNVCLKEMRMVRVYTRITYEMYVSSQDTKYICVDAKNVKGPLELYRIIQDQLVKE